jgi:hypothetical protein
MPSFDTAARNLFVGAVTNWNSGTLELLSAADAVLAVVTIPASGFTSPTSGVIEKNGVWQGVGTSAASTGTVCTKARLITSGGATINLTAGADGSGAEVEISNNIVSVNDDVIVEDNAVVVTDLTITFPAGP